MRRATDDLICCRLLDGELGHAGEASLCHDRRVRKLPIGVAYLLAASVAVSATEARADEWWGTDKALHFGVSAGLAGGSYAVIATQTESRSVRCLAAAATSLALGAAKEGYDAAGHGDASWRDFTWDVVGTAVGVTLAYVIDQLASSGTADAPVSNASPAALVIAF